MQKNLGYVIPSIVIPDETNNIGYWYLGSVPLGVRATGTIWTIGNDHYWYVDGTKTNYLAEIPVETYNQQWSDLLSRCNNDWTTLKQECDEDWADWLATANSEKNTWFTNANSLLNNYSGQFSDMLSNDTVEFTEWFERIQGQLTEDAAGHLQTEIDKLNLVVEGLDSAVVPKGDCAFADLPAFADIIPGWMYNITDDFVSDSRFKDGSGKSYAAGTNVYFLQKQTGTETVVRDPVTKNGVTMDFDTVTDNSFTLDGTKKAADAIRFNLADVTLDGDSYRITLSNSGDLPNLMTLRLIGVQGNTETQLYTSNALGVMDILLTSAQLATYDRYYLRLFLDSGASKIFETEEYSITVHNVTQDTDVSLDLKHITQPVYTNYWDVIGQEKISVKTYLDMDDNDNAASIGVVTEELLEFAAEATFRTPTVRRIKLSSGYDSHDSDTMFPVYSISSSGATNYAELAPTGNTESYYPANSNLLGWYVLSFSSNVFDNESIRIGTSSSWTSGTNYEVESINRQVGIVNISTEQNNVTVYLKSYHEGSGTTSSGYFLMHKIPEVIVNYFNNNMYNIRMFYQNLNYNWKKISALAINIDRNTFRDRLIVSSFSDACWITPRTLLLGNSQGGNSTQSESAINAYGKFAMRYSACYYDSVKSAYYDAGYVHITGTTTYTWFPNVHLSTNYPTHNHRSMWLMYIVAINQSSKALVGIRVAVVLSVDADRNVSSGSPTVMNLGVTSTAPGSVTAVAKSTTFPEGALTIKGSNAAHRTSFYFIRLQ